MTVEILWVEDKVLHIMDYSRQKKTFASEEKALECAEETRRIFCR